MARDRKTPVLLVVVLLVIMAFITYRLYNSSDGFRNVDCLGVNCKEGEFCQDNTCKAVSPPYTNKY